MADVPKPDMSSNHLLSKPMQFIAQTWQDLPLALKGLIVITLPLTVLLASLGSLYIREQETTALENKLSLALQNQRDIQTVHTQLLEASTGIRDYLLTGDKDFLGIYYRAEKMLPVILHKLEDQLESEQQKQRLALILPLVEQNINMLNVLSENESDVASDALIMQFKQQVDSLDRLRKEIENLNAEEALLVAEDQESIYQQRQQNIRVTMLAAIAGIIGSLVAVWIFSRTIVGRVRLLRDSAHHLAKAEALDLPSSSRDELGQLSNELDQASQLLAKNINDALQARHEAEEASTSKSMFLSRTSHELRTPLNAILGFAQLLEEDLAPGKQRDSVLMMKGAGEHLLKLINEVLEITRIESGELSLELNSIPINDLLEEAKHYIAPMGKIRDIDIVCLHEPNLWVMANRQKLLQVVLNLLSNALKYGPVNSTVQLKAYQQQEMVVIEVLDAGPGIPAPLRARLFTPFDRLGAEQTKVEGTGLGLALCKQIMHAMHGDIDVADDKSLFWVTLPAASPSQESTSPNIPKVEAVSQTLQSKHTLLYVEDNASNRTLVEAIIKRQKDLHILCVPTMKEAKQLLSGITPSLLLIDLNLPDGSGELLVKYVKSQAQFAHIPIMILSADALPATIKRTEAAGVDCYLTKPLDVALFNKKIRELLSKQETHERN
jgi:signal transduction histidine kinase/ActR/RegA family two-component response regulator